MKVWQPVSNGGKFYVQLTGTYAVHEDSRGRQVQYQSIEGARKAADELNRAMSQAALILFHRAHTAKRAVDHINGDTTDNRPENLRIVTLNERHRILEKRREAAS